MNKKTLKEYRIWKAMKSRCYAPSYSNSYYQKDEIKVCDRWKNSFENFLEDMGSIPSDEYSIERLDVKGDYCKENCVWIPVKEQPKNRRNSLFFTHNGETKCLKEWSKILGFSYSSVRKRIVYGNIPFEVAIDENNFSRLVTLGDESHTVTEWCEIKGLNAGCVFSRIHRGWSKEDSLTKDIEKIKILESEDK